MRIARLDARIIIPWDPFYEKLSRKQEMRDPEDRKNNGRGNKTRLAAKTTRQLEVALAFASSRMNRLLIVCMASAGLEGWRGESYCRIEFSGGRWAAMWVVGAEKIRGKFPGAGSAGTRFVYRKR